MEDATTRRAKLAQQRALAFAIANSACLGPFAVALGLVGFDAAVALCASRDFPQALLDKWAELAYRPAQMPSADEIRLVVLGVEIQRVTNMQATNRKPAPVLASFSCGAKEAQRALKTCELFGAAPGRTKTANLRAL
jgi:hypothetical protein